MRLFRFIFMAVVLPVCIVLALLAMGVFSDKSSTFYSVGTLISLVVGLGASYWLVNLYRKSEHLKSQITNKEQKTIC